MIRVALALIIAFALAHVAVKGIANAAFVAAQSQGSHE